MNEVYEYMQERYKKTKWRFFNYNELTSRFGKSTRKQLNNIWKQGLIEKREGCNAPLIELK